MKRLTTLTGKNLPRLAVAKPGWPEPTLEQLMVIDAHLNSGVESETVREIRQTIENDKLARDLAYEAYLANIDPLTGNPPSHRRPSPTSPAYVTKTTTGADVLRAS